MVLGKLGLLSSMTVLMNVFGYQPGYFGFLNTSTLDAVSCLEHKQNEKEKRLASNWNVAQTQLVQCLHRTGLSPSRKIAAKKLSSGITWRLPSCVGYSDI